MKRYIKMGLVLVVLFALSACSAQRQFASRLRAEWNIEKYEMRSVTGDNVVIENAGTIVFSSGNEGSQTFTTAIVHAAESANTSFTWTNTTRTVAITSVGSQTPKVWIVVDGGRSKQVWYSTDSEGNVQMMQLRRNK